MTSCQENIIGSQQFVPIMNIHQKSKFNQCEFATVQTENLKSHLKSHSAVKSYYKYNQCEYTTVHRNNLRNHLKMHTGVKSFRCNQCYYTFLVGKVYTVYKVHKDFFFSGPKLYFYLMGNLGIE